MSKLNSLGLSLALGWIIYLGLLAAAKVRGTTASESIVTGIADAARTGLWDTAIAQFVGASIPLLLLGYLVRRLARPVTARLNAWLDEPVPRKSATRPVDEREPK